MATSQAVFMGPVIAAAGRLRQELAKLRFSLRSLVWHRSIFMVPALRYFHQKRFGMMPSLFRPRRFNEKLYVRMAVDRRPLLTQLAGKLESRDFVTARLGRDDLQPKLLATLRHPDDTAGLNLPSRWIMKASHASGSLRIVTEDAPISEGELSRLVAKWLTIDYGRYLLEWAYHGLERVVVVEELLEHQGDVPRDIKFFCFDGKVVYIQVDSDRFDDHRQSLFDSDWNPLDVTVNDYLPHLQSVAKPQSLPEMIRIAECLSAGIDFLRVDLYDLGAQVMVGELTVYPQGGGGRFNPPSWDLTFGAHWRLPKLSVMRGWSQSSRSN